MYQSREQYEWTNCWWEHADAQGDRVLLIGDSISVGYRLPTQIRLESRFFCDLMATSKFVADTSYLKELRYFLTEYPYVAVHFNNGLHGIELSNEDYERAYREALDTILDKCKKVVLVTSTPITCVSNPAKLDPVKNAVVLARNEIVLKIAAEYDLPVNDLYGAVVGQTEIKTDDGYHFNGDGYSLISEFVAKAIENVL